jgi:hypothetical protein
VRKWIATSLILALFTSFTITADAAIKPGASCKKLGQTSIYSGKKYTCIKTGKNLGWDKGAVLKPKPIPKSSSTSSETQTESSTPSKNPNEHNSQTSSQNLDYWVDSEWYQKTLSISKEAREFNQDLHFSKIYQSPNFNESISDGLSEYTRLAANFWFNQGFSTPENLEIAFITEKDKTWFERNVSIVAPVVNNFFNHPDSTLYFNGTVIVDRIPARRFVIVYFVGSEYIGSNKFLSTTTNWKTALATMATHEYQHLIQYKSTLTTNFGNLQNKLPCWFNEGMAAFYEDSIFIESGNSAIPKRYLQEFLDNRAEVLNIRFKRIDLLLSNTKKYGFETKQSQDWSKFIFENYFQQSIGCISTQYGYTLGKFLHEKLYIDYGSKIVINLLQDFQVTQDFSLSFKNTFHVSETEWLLNTGLPYFISQLNG